MSLYRVLIQFLFSWLYLFYLCICLSALNILWEFLLLFLSFSMWSWALLIACHWNPELFGELFISFCVSSGILPIPQCFANITWLIFMRVPWSKLLSTSRGKCKYSTILQVKSHRFSSSVFRKRRIHISGNLGNYCHMQFAKHHTKILSEVIIQHPVLRVLFYLPWDQSTAIFIIY